MATIDEFITSLRDEFGEQVAGKKFEVFCKWFLENDPEWSKRIDKVWLWDDYPKKWQRQDLGTDLVFQDKEGLVWAVQAKCYSEHRSTNKGDMNSFLADTGRKEVHKRLWLQTTNKMEAKADKTLKGQDKPVTVFNLNDFRDAQIDYPSSYYELFQAKVKVKPTPDTHQIEAIEAVQSKLQSLDRGQMIMACGTGKTFTTLWIKEALNAHTTLVLLPSLSLLSQTMREWAWAGNTDFDILNVCSDKSVGKKTEDMEPSDAPFPVTSEIDEITKFIKAPNPKVIFCTYQSSPLIAEAQLDPNVPAFDLTIADEAHRCAGKADAGFATVLDAQKIRSTKRLFTTATPRYFGKVIKDEAKARDLAVVGMDDENVFGAVIHKLTFGEAIRRELLTDYQVVIVGVDEPMVKQWIDDYEIVATNPDEHTDARTLAAKVGLIKAIRDYDLKRVISFHSRVKGAKEFAEELVDVVDLIDPIHRPEGLFLADYVSGEMKAGDRKDKIDRLKVLDGYDRGILTNARCLAEGVDVPSLDGVAFIDPRGSQVEIIQAVGRAIRKVRGAETQTKGTIVIPVFIEDGDDPEASIEASNFKPVWDVLKALRAHDEVLADALDRCRTDMAKAGSGGRRLISDKIVFDIPRSVDVEFSNALRTLLVKASSASWEFWYGLLEVFRDREGHCWVSQLHKEGELNLGTWAASQRANKDTLTLERIERLDAVGFIWAARGFIEGVSTVDWETGFSKLQQFLEREGHCRVSASHKEDGFRLKGWVKKQRSNKDTLIEDRINRLDALGFIWDPLTELWEDGFRKLQEFKEREGHTIGSGAWVSTQRSNKDKLTLERIERLDALGFIWDAHKESWDEGFSQLQEFKEREGHVMVPLSHKEGEFKLGQWVSRQRGSQDALTLERIERLDALGFIWDPITELWEEGFSKLQQFHEREGHAKVPGSHKEGEYKLGQWVSKKRSNIDQLTLERIERLDALGFIWDVFKQLWEEGFSKFQEFKGREGHARVPTSHKEGEYKLGQWVSVQRSNIDKVTLERIKRLDALGFIWDPFKELWEEGFSKLQQFHEREGHAKVPGSHKEGEYKLGQWVGRQRGSRDAPTIERIERLDALGFIWDPITELWEEGFSKLQQFHEREGHAKVPASHKEDEFKLGQWVCRRRSRKNTLTLEHIERLDALGFIWDTKIEQWEVGFSMLQEFKDRSGHCRVTAKHKEGEGINLGIWVGAQRSNKNSLTAERINRLNAIGFIWDGRI